MDTLSPQTIKILLIEDDEEDAVLVRAALAKIRRWKHELVWAAGYDEGLRAFEEGGFSVVLVDYHLGERTGLEFLQETSTRGNQAPVIFLTGEESYEQDVEAMQAGAMDYLTKASLNPLLLERSIRYSIEHKQSEHRLREDAQRAELLAKLSRDFTEAGLDYRGLLNTIARRISDTFGDASIIRILAEDQETLLPAAIYHPDPEARELMMELISATTQRVGNGLVGEVAIKKEPQLSLGRSPEEWAASTQREFLPWFKQYPVHSIFAVPLCTPKKLIGTLTIIRGQTDHPFTQTEQQFFVDLADRAAMSIENASLHQEVERLALTDPLTGLLNRRGFSLLGGREFSRHQRYNCPLSAIMLDIDHFKSVNDTYGHAFGDEVLRSISENCTANIRSMDIATRYGGDEFLILLPEIDESTAGRVAERIRACFAENRFQTGEEAVGLTVSLGVSTATAGIKDLDELIRRADQALYLSKHKGRNRVEIW